MDTVLTYPLLSQQLEFLAISDKDYLSNQELYNALCQLNCEEYDHETYDELWD